MADIHTINIDGRALSHDLLPIGITGPSTFLSRFTVNQLHLTPGTGYSFQPGSGIVADFSYGVSEDGQVIIAPEFAEVASASGNTLTIRGRTINIDGRRLSHDLLPIGILGDGVFLPRATVNQLTIIPANGYSFQPGSGIVADFSYGIGRDGQVILAREFAEVASASGNTLTIRGRTINIDGRRLSHDLLPTGIVGDGRFLPRTTINKLTMIPARRYGFQPGSINGDMSYDVRVDGAVDYPESCDGFLIGRGTDTLVVGGYPIVVDATHADSNLLGIVTLGLPAQTPRRFTGVLMPGGPYVPQTANGVFRTAFNLIRDGSVTFDPAAAGSYVLRPSSPNPSRVGQEVTVTVTVLPIPGGSARPQGSVTFSENAVFLGSAPLDERSTATFRTSSLSLGVHHIDVHYPGDQHFQRSSAIVRHRVA